MKRLLPLLLFAALAACRRSKRDPPPPEPPPGPDFPVQGEPLVADAPSDPEAAWRFLESQVTAQRAEANALGEEILLTFEAGAFHVTRRSGRRRTWVLPASLRLEDEPVRLLVRPDLTCGVWGAGGPKTPESGEITVVRGRLEGPAGNVRIFRLVVKGGREFRSIETAG